MRVRVIPLLDGPLVHFRDDQGIADWITRKLQAEDVLALRVDGRPARAGVPTLAPVPALAVVLLVGDAQSHMKLLGAPHKHLHMHIAAHCVQNLHRIPLHLVRLHDEITRLQLKGGLHILVVAPYQPWPQSCDVYSGAILHVVVDAQDGLGRVVEGNGEVLWIALWKVIAHHPNLDSQERANVFADHPHLQLPVEALRPKALVCQLHPPNWLVLATSLRLDHLELQGVAHLVLCKDYLLLPAWCC
mmetsp:Transcript_2303/g.5273  ORF Transcript_2303/g.5273 Transcript_2303/m.5273 type:complete len:245 (+) Transcript_2303:454-1188(+)